MGQGKVQVRLTNAREAVLAQLGHLQAAQGCITSTQRP
jgi:hypothetical protein